MSEPAAGADGSNPDGSNSVVVPEALSLTLHVNGAEYRVKARPHHTLVETLRNELRLFSVREGCGVGMCGACTILIDDEIQSGCLVLSITAEGREIQTVEGLANPDGTLTDLQRAFVEKTAFQCSYCTPGFILTAKRLLEEDPLPDDETIAEYLAGNLCRCGSYAKIRAAVRAVASRRADERMVEHDLQCSKR